MATVSFSHNEIDQVRDFTAADTETVIRYLQHYNGSTERAISAIIDNERLPEENPVNSVWDDSAWTTDNAGNAQEGAQPAFGEYLQPNPAPSRPPSRVSNRSKAGSMRDANEYSTMSQEDWELQRATKISLGEDPGPMPPLQQTGVVDSSGQTVFGPATKAEYDESSWALTRVGTTHSAVEIAEHPQDPFERKRDDGHPAVLSPISRGEQGFKPALLAILHAIPAARNALHFPSFQQEDLSQSETWYQGDQINQTIIMEDSSNLKTQDLDIIIEVQRLMAFLDGSERKYAVPKHLADILDSRENSAGDYAKVLEQWIDIADKIRPDQARRKLFTTRVVHTNTGGESHYVDHICFRLELAGPIQNLYEKFNSVLWPSTDHRAFVKAAADIICIDIHQKWSGAELEGLGLFVPPTIYLDRYLEENQDAIRVVHEDMIRHETAAKTLKERVNRISQHTNSMNSKTIAGTDLLQTTISFLREDLGRKQAGSLDVSNNGAEHGHESDPIGESTIKQLEGILDWLKQKVDGLTLRIEEHEEAIKDARQQLMQEELGTPQCHRYSLRGVCVEGKKTYVLRPAESNSGAGSWRSSVDENGFQWWCQDFSWSSTKDFAVTEVPIDDVVNDASSNGKDVLLVYASDKACSEQNQPLPIALHNFVAQDNLLFDRELQSYTGTATSQMDWEADELDAASTSGFDNPIQSRDPNVQHLEHFDGDVDKSGADREGNPSRMDTNWNFDETNETEQRWHAAHRGRALTKEDEEALLEHKQRLNRSLTMKERKIILIGRVQAAAEDAGIWGDPEMDGGEGFEWKGG